MEIRIEPFIQDTFNKYLSTDQTDEYLFNFHSRYSNSDSFNANINMGIRQYAKIWECPRRNIIAFIRSVIPGQPLLKTIVEQICMR